MNSVNPCHVMDHVSQWVNVALAFSDPVSSGIKKLHNVSYVSRVSLNVLKSIIRNSNGFLLSVNTGMAGTLDAEFDEPDLKAWSHWGSG